MGLFVFIGVSIALIYLFGGIAYFAGEANKKQEEKDKRALAEYEHQTQVDEKERAFLDSDFRKKLESILVEAIDETKADCLNNGGPARNCILIGSNEISIGCYAKDSDGASYYDTKKLFSFEERGYQTLSNIDQEAVAQGMARVLRPTVPNISTDRNSIFLPNELYQSSLDEYRRRQEAEYQANYKKAF